jgi:hypothetical protein
VAMGEGLFTLERRKGPGWERLPVVYLQCGLVRGGMQETKVE